MQTLRKVFAVSVIFVTVLSLSLSAVPAFAAASAGDLIKMSGLSSVYYLGADGKRYVFPNEQTYFSWYGDFSTVLTIPQSELEALPLGANVTIRPGTKLVKITTNPKVYAVEPGGSLVAIPDEATAKTLYGDNWAKRIVDVPDAFFTNYKTSAKVLTSTAYPAGQLVKTATEPTVYYIGTDGKAQKITTESAFTANRLKFGDVVTAAAGFVLPALGGDIGGAISAITDTSSGAGGTIATGGSGVTVSLSASTPAAASVPSNGSRVPMAKLNLTAASDGAITLSSLVVKRIGLSSSGQIPSVWAEKDGVTVASKKSVNTNDEANLTFSPALVIPAGATVSLDLLASLSGATGNIGLSVASASAVGAGGATVSGAFPINGNLMAPITYTVANLGIYGTSTTNIAVKVGDEKVTLGQFTIGFNGTGKDVTIKSIMIKNNGVEDLAKATMNLYLEQAGNKVTESATVSGRFVTFTFPAGYQLLKDDSEKIFFLKGDVIAKESTDASSFSFALSKSTDLNAYETSTGFGVNVFNASTGTTLADNRPISTVTVSAGVITVSKKSTSPADTTIVKGSDNTVLIANVRADEAVTADGLNVIYGSSASAAATVDQFENVRVYLNGVLLDSFDITATSGALVSKALSSSLTLNKGDNEIKVMARAKTNAAANSAFLAKLDSTILTSQNPTYVSSGNAVTVATDVSGTATGGIFTVQGASITTVRNDGFADGKVIVKGSTDVLVGRFAVKATNDTVTVTSITFGGNISASGTDVAASSVYDAKLFVNGTQVGTTLDFGGSGVNFSSLNFTIAKDVTAVVELKLSFDSSAAGGFKSLMTVNAQDSRGTAVTAGTLTANSADFTLTDAGSLSVALGGSTPADGLLAAKAVQQTIAEYKFTAVNDSANLTKLVYFNSASSTATATADSLVAALYLYDGSTLLDSSLFVNGLGEFNFADKAIVPANGIKTLTVKVLLNPISNDAAATNKDLKFKVSTVDFKSSSGNSTVGQAVNLAGNSFRIRKTVPTVALQTLPTTVAAAGDQVIMKFTVTADAAGDVSVYKLQLAATSSGFTIAGLAANAVRINGVPKATASSTYTGNATYTVNFGVDNPEVVAAGTSKTFEVVATIGGAPANGSITAKIDEDAAFVTDGTGNFVWSDGADILNPTYSNGRRVSGLPTATQALTK